jgi:hypothetical protein
MNRRDIVKSAVASLTASVPAAKASVIPPGGPGDPLLAVIHVDYPLTKSSIERIRSVWNRLRENEPRLPQCIIMPQGFSFSTMPSLVALTDRQREAIRVAIRECESMPVATSRAAAEVLREMIGERA